MEVGNIPQVKKGAEGSLIMKIKFESVDPSWNVLLEKIDEILDSSLKDNYRRGFNTARDMVRDMDEKIVKDYANELCELTMQEISSISLDDVCYEIALRIRGQSDINN